MEFLEVDAVQSAIALTDTEIHGRKLKVSAKRTNVPGMNDAGAAAGRPALLAGRGGLQPLHADGDDDDEPLHAGAPPVQARTRQRRRQRRQRRGRRKARAALRRVPCESCEKRTHAGTKRLGPFPRHVPL